MKQSKWIRCRACDHEFNKRIMSERWFCPTCEREYVVALAASGRIKATWKEPIQLRLPL